MKLLLLSLISALIPMHLFAQARPGKAPVPARLNAPETQELQTEKIGESSQTNSDSQAQPGPPGLLDANQVKSLMHRTWLAQYHLTDLLTQVHPEKWKISAPTRESFDQSIDSLRKSITAEENWRGQFEARPDSLYLGFETYMAIGAVLPRVEGAAKSVSLYENASFGGQFTQAANQLFDLQQVLAPHLQYLLKNQDNAMLVIQSNLSSCQRELSFAEHDKEGHARPMKNILPEFKGRKRPAHPPAAK